MLNFTTLESSLATLWFIRSLASLWYILYVEIQKNLRVLQCPPPPHQPTTRPWPCYVIKLLSKELQHQMTHHYFLHIPINKSLRG